MDEGSFSSSKESLKSLLMNKTYAVNIPSYQRPYTWRKKLARNLFDTLFRAWRRSEEKNDKLPSKKSDSPFIGVMVFVDASPHSNAFYRDFQNLREVSPSKREHCLLDVVDGQQRLTTLLMLLNMLVMVTGTVSDNLVEEVKAIKKLLVIDEFSAESKRILTSSGIQTRLIRDRVDPNIREKVIACFSPFKSEEWHRMVNDTRGKANATDMLSTLQENVRAMKNDWETKIKKVLGAESKKLEKLQEMALKFARYIMEECQFLCMYATDLDEAYNIFLTLNSDLKQPLNDVDLLKGYMFQYLQCEDLPGRNADSDPLGEFNGWWDEVKNSEEEIRQTFINVYRFWAATSKFVCLPSKHSLLFTENHKATDSDFFLFIKENLKAVEAPIAYAKALRVLHHRWLEYFYQPNRWGKNNKKLQDMGMKAWKSYRTLEFLSAMAHGHLSTGVPVGEERQILSSWKAFVSAFILKNSKGATLQWEPFFKLLIDLDHMMLVALTHTRWRGVANFITERFVKFCGENGQIEVPIEIRKDAVYNRLGRCSGENAYTANPVFVRYVLVRLNVESDLRGDISLDKLRESEIDHIMPQKNQSEAANIHCLGNLQLLEADINKSVANLESAAKMEKLYASKSIYQRVQEVARLGDWGVDHIKSHQSKLFDELVRLYNISEKKDAESRTTSEDEDDIEVEAVNVEKAEVQELRDLLQRLADTDKALLALKQDPSTETQDHTQATLSREGVTEKRNEVFATIEKWIERWLENGSWTDENGNSILMLTLQSGITHESYKEISKHCRDVDLYAVNSEGKSLYYYARTKGNLKLEIPEDLANLLKSAIDKADLGAFYRYMHVLADGFPLKKRGWLTTNKLLHFAINKCSNVEDDAKQNCLEMITYLVESGAVLAPDQDQTTPNAGKLWLDKITDKEVKQCLTSILEYHYALKKDQEDKKQKAATKASVNGTAPKKSTRNSTGTEWYHQFWGHYVDNVDTTKKHSQLKRTKSASKLNTPKPPKSAKLSDRPKKAKKAKK